MSVPDDLGMLVASRFKTLLICETKHFNLESVCFRSNRRSGPHLWTDRIDVAREFVLAGVGEWLQTLVVGADMDDERCYATMILLQTFGRK